MDFASSAKPELLTWAVFSGSMPTRWCFSIECDFEDGFVTLREVSFRPHPPFVFPHSSGFDPSAAIAERDVFRARDEARLRSSDHSLSVFPLSKRDANKLRPFLRMEEFGCYGEPNVDPFHYRDWWALHFEGGSPRRTLPSIELGYVDDNHPVEKLLNALGSLHDVLFDRCKGFTL